MAQLFSERHSYLDYPSWPAHNDVQWPTTFDSSPSSPSTPSVKVEPDDSPACFIMELSPPHVQTSLAPPTEVPLRATQASKKMRGMMTVFRLNPFAIHSGEGRGLVSAIREEARPLEEEPLIFEFQLDIDGVRPDEPDMPPQQLLHTFSPDFELHDVPLESDPTPWEDSGRSESSYPTTPSWDLNYPPTLASDAHYPFPEDPSSHPRHISRLQNSVSHPYLRKDTTGRDFDPSSAQLHEYGPSYSNSNLTSPGLIDVGEHFGQPPDLSYWTRGGYVPTLRTSNTYGSPGSNPPVPIASINRRWSLPDTHPNIHMPFLT